MARCGALWFTEMNTDAVGRMTASGAITEFPLPIKGGLPSMTTAGPDHGLWFTLNQANAIGRIGFDGAVTVHDLPTTGAGPVGITVGTDQALWFVEIAARQIGRIAGRHNRGVPAARPRGQTTRDRRRPGGRLLVHRMGRNA